MSSKIDYLLDIANTSDASGVLEEIDQSPSVFVVSVARISDVRPKVFDALASYLRGCLCKNLQVNMWLENRFL